MVSRIVALVFTLSCASTQAPLPILPHLTWATPVERDPSLPSIGLARFEDTRPIEVRNGSSPGIQFGWFSIRREGDHRTGDAAFAGDLVMGLRRDARETLVRSGDFSDVQTVEFDPLALDEAELAHALSSAQLDYALSATLDEFAGVQYQSFSMTPMRVGWIRNRFGPASGRVSVSYRLYDKKGIVWSERINTDHESPDATIVQAALDSMAITNEALAQAVHTLVAAQRPRSMRVIPVRVLDGCDLGRKRAARLIAEVSRVFSREADLLFRPEYQIWDPPDAPWHPAPLLDALTQIDPSEGGFVVGLARFGKGQTPGLPDDRYGLSRSFGRHAIARCESRKVEPLTVIHEFGHLMGAVHVSDRASVMHPKAVFDARFFDPLNRRILLAIRDREIGRPLSREVINRLGAIYRAASRFPDKVEPRGLELTLNALERIPSSKLGQ